MKTLDTFALTGKVALLTGPEGAYGKAIAFALCEAGAKLFLATRHPAEANAVAGELKAAGYDASVIEYDPTCQESITKMRDAVVSAAGRIDVFVDNNTNDFTTGWDAPIEEIAKVLRAYEMGTIVTTKLVGDVMAQQKSGSIIFISSVYGYVGPYTSAFFEAPADMDWAYSIDQSYIKGAYVNYARQVSSYLGQFGARANTLCPAPLASGLSEPFKKHFSIHSTLRRLPGEEDIKGAVVFLASDASAYIAGVTIPVDGGYAAK